MKGKENYLHYYDPLYEVSRFGDHIGTGGRLRSWLKLGTGQVDLNKSIMPLINCPEVSRMNWLNQAGFISLIFPSGTHSRFSHSLGTLHLGSIALSSVSIQDVKNGESYSLLEILKKKSWIEEFLVALFLHDVGHLPFSHTLENNYGLKNILGKEVSHEEIACEIIKGEGSFYESYKRKFSGPKNKLISDVLQYQPLYQKDIICYLISENNDITNLKLKGNDREILKIMHELVSGDFDLDRIDHYRRDSFFTGLGHSFKPYVLLEGLNYKIGNNDLKPVANPTKDAKGQISTLLFIKDQLHEYCFSDLRNISYNAMLNHALTMHLNSCIDENKIEEAYSILSMTDGLLIYHLLHSKSQLCKEIIDDIINARPYKCVAKIEKQNDSSSKLIKKLLSCDENLMAGFPKHFDSPDKSWLSVTPKENKQYCFIFSNLYDSQIAMNKMNACGLKSGPPSDDEENIFHYLES